MRKGKPVRQLPSRGGLNDLDKSKRTIIDYGKATPITPSQPQDSIVQALLKRREK